MRRSFRLALLATIATFGFTSAFAADYGGEGYSQAGIGARENFNTVIPRVRPSGGVRIKDITTIKGVRDNQLVGYGLVIGLQGTGDSLRNSPFTEQSLQSMLDRMGVNVRSANPRTRNVAAVVVTFVLFAGCSPACLPARPPAGLVVSLLLNFVLVARARARCS